MSESMRIDNGRGKQFVRHVLLSNAVLFVLLGLLAFNILFTKNFASINILWLLIRQSASIMCVAMGMSFVVATGNIDISVGPAMALAAVVCVQIEQASGSYLYGALGALGACLLCGAFNGILVSVFKIQSMIATLITQMVFRAAAQLVSAWVITIKGETVRFLGLHAIGGLVPIQVVPVVVLALLVWFLLKKTIFGKRLEAVGCNQRAARISGINTIGIMMVGYMLCSFCAGLGGLMELFRSAACDTSTFGNNYEINAIAAIAIGGTAMNGGNTRIIGTIYGVLIMQIITMMINMNNINYNYGNIIKCIIIIIAIYVQNRKK